MTLDVPRFRRDIRPLFAMRVSVEAMAFRIDSIRTTTIVGPESLPAVMGA